MSRIFWDSMLFIHLFDGSGAARKRCEALLVNALDRDDSLFTNYLVLGEYMAGAQKASPTTRGIIRSVLEEMGFSFLAFDGDAVQTFSLLRAEHGVKAPDSINLSCAAAAGVDLFLTGDKRLQKLAVPGIREIADFEDPIR